jgi:hypothetical protein
MKAKRWFVAVWLAAACCSAATPGYHHSPSRLSFPPELAGLPLTKTEEFPNPALGIGLTYKADNVVLSIFVFTGGLRGIYPEAPRIYPERLRMYPAISSGSATTSPGEHLPGPPATS